MTQRVQREAEARPHPEPHSEEAELRRRVQRLEERLQDQEQRLAWIQEIGSAIATHGNQQELLNFVIERITRIMRAERATLFILDEKERRLWSRFVAGEAIEEIEVAIGEGLVGWVAQHGRSVNVKDAYRDPRFRTQFDQRTGFRTRSVLCQPLRNKGGQIIGVVQVLNKGCGGWFSVDDEAMLHAIATTTAIVIENNRLYLREVERNMALLEAQDALELRVAELDALYRMQRTLLGADELEEVCEQVAVACLDLLPSEACGLHISEAHGGLSFVLERDGREGRFISRQSDEDLSLTRWVMRSGETKVCNDLTCLPSDRFLRALAFRPHNLAAAPLLVGDSAVGTLFLVNRDADSRSRDLGEGYSEADRKLLALAAGQIAVAISKSVARRRAQEEDRLSTIGRMLSGILHDVKTPLTIVRGYVQLMEREANDERRRLHGLTIRRQFENLERMTHEVLAYARGESSLLYRDVILSEFVSSVREGLAQEFSRTDIALGVSTSVHAKGRFDDGKLMRIIFNLARNARSAMNGPGRFDVDFERQGGELVIRCTDTGPGIDPALQESLFEAFVTGTAGGTGLGLAIVRKLVDEHEGRVSFESTPGEGTTFEVRIPAFQDAEEQPPAAH